MIVPLHSSLGDRARPCLKKICIIQKLRKARIKVFYFTANLF